MGIVAIRKFPEDVAKGLICDEVHTTLIAMGVPSHRVGGCDKELFAAIDRARKLSDKDAFDHIVKVSKASLLKLGVEDSLVERVRFE